MLHEGHAVKEPVDRQVFHLGRDEENVRERMEDLEEKRFGERIWAMDARLWTSDPGEQGLVRESLGWLHAAEKMEENLGHISSFVSEVRRAGLRHAILLGMGGSSLAPLLFHRTLKIMKSMAPVSDGLPVTVLDTTNPAAVLDAEGRFPIQDTLFLVSSKSGTTAEPRALAEYFYDRVKAVKGERAGESFVAVTDPGTPLAALARSRGFRRIFLNFPDIGGRYSALSYVGLVPAALMGVNVSALLIRALRMVHACGACVPFKENPGLVLGAVLGEMARRGRDKVTFLAPAPLEALGMWLEQLLAESTGKQGTGLLPVAGEPLGEPAAYGRDRLFVHLRLKGLDDEALDRGCETLREAGHPVITIRMDDLSDLGQEFFRWEIAVAAAGAVLGINPFDQPNVQESKDNTDGLLAEMTATGRLEEDGPDLTDGPLAVYARKTGQSAGEALRLFLSKARPGGYVALMAYLTEDEATEAALQDIRLRLRDGLRLAVTTGFGPRLLHSTGQYHKGGPNTGLFIQITADDREDVPIPGRRYTFGFLRRAQALGDLEALKKHRRKVIRIHLGPDTSAGLAALKKAVGNALGPPS